MLQMPANQTGGDHMMRELGGVPATPTGVTEDATPKVGLEGRLRVH